MKPAVPICAAFLESIARRVAAGLLAHLLIVAMAAAAAAQSEPPGGSTVGATMRSYVDAARQSWDGTALRPLTTTIWYPAAGSAREDTVFVGEPGAALFVAGTAAADAELSARRELFPLILLSHGTGGTASQMMWLGRHLAANGFIVAAVNHHGNTAAEAYPTPQGFMLWWERAADLSAVLDQLLADPVLGPRIDPARIGAAGFSLGGYTVVSIAGAITDLGAYEAFCAGPRRDANCEPQAEFPDAFDEFARVRDEPQVQRSLARHAGSFRDDRVRAVLAIAPALGGAFTDAGLASVDVPVHVVAAGVDDVTPPATNAHRFVAGIDGAEVTVLDGVGHYTFLAPCTERGRRELPTWCVDRHADRAAVHRQVQELALRFFGERL